MTAPVVITLDMDAKCAECGKGGASGSGLCMRCCTKAMDPKRAMKSPQGRALQAMLAAKFAAMKQERPE